MSRINAIHERLKAHGAIALSLPELFACAQHRYPTERHVDEARALLREHNGVRESLSANYQLEAARELTARALKEELMSRPRLESPRDSAAFFKAKLAHLQYEVFACLFLDNRHRVLAYEEMFRGTLDGASVHPREVVRASLKWNAAAVIFSHGHPSGVSEPSAADRNITRQLRDALQLVGVRVLDHIVVGTGEPTSMAARGLI